MTASLDPTVEVAERPWVLWEWRDGALDFDTYPTLRDVAEAAQQHEDWGHASFERIEGPGTHEEIAAAWEAVRAELRDADSARRAEREARPKVQWVVQVSLPADAGWSDRKTRGDRRTARVAFEHDRAAADEAAAQWSRQVGADRVAVVSAEEAGVRW